MEGGIDSSHVSFLHRGNINSDPLFKGAKGNQYNLNDARPVFEVVESAGGLYIGARRNAEDGNYYWRITQWVHAVLHHDRAARRPSRPRPLLDSDRRRELLGLELRLPSGARHHRRRSAARCTTAKASTCKFEPGTFRPLANKDNDYLMDRAAQKRGHSFSGIEGIAMQDASLQESMGPIVDRTKENLVSTDNGIIMARHRLMRAAKALAEKGVMPPGVDAAHQRVRSASVILPQDQPFKDAAKEVLKVRVGFAPATV